MLIQKNKFIGILIFLSILWVNCSDKNKDSGFDLLALFDLGGTSGGQSPNASVIPAYNNVDNNVATLPANFGQTGPQAHLFINSYENVNRYKDLEIQFSKPMNRALTEASITLQGTTGPLAGPGIGVEFYWASEQRLILNPYRELKPGEKYTLSINPDALTVSNKPLIAYSQEFKTTLNYSLNNSIVQGPMTRALNGTDDISLDTSADVTINSTFQNPVSGENHIDSVFLKKSGSGSSIKICPSAAPGSTCSMNPISLNLSSSSLPPSIGGNTYYYEIQTKFGPSYKKYFSFNFGNLTNPNNLLANISNGVMDEAQMLPFLGKVIQKFTTGAFKVQDINGTPRTFQEFLIGLPDHSKKKFYDNGQWNIGEACIRPGQAGSGGTNKIDDFKNQEFISVLGAKPGAEGRGYCWVPSSTYPTYPTSIVGPKGAEDQGEWAFDKWPKAAAPFSRYNAPLEDSLGAASMTMDVYVTDMRLPSFVKNSSGTQLGNIAADLKVNPGTANTAPGLGLDLSSRYVEVDLFIVSRYEDWYTIFISPGTLMYFKTTARLNWDPNVDPNLNGGNNVLPNIYLTTPSLRMARARNSITVDSTGTVSMAVRSPFAVTNSIFPNFPTNADIDSVTNNFFVLPWSNPTFLPMGIYSGAEDTKDFMYTAPMEYIASNEGGVDNILVPLIGRGTVQNLAGGTVPYVKGIITQYMLKDIVQRIAPNVLNSVVGALRDDGVTIQLPSYLPAPLKNFPLTVKMKLREESVIKHDGTNKGLVSNLDLSFSSNYVDPQGRGLRTQAAKSGMILTRNSATPFPSTYQFTQSNANPGFLLSLHSDTISQAAFHLWQRRGLDINMNKAFIDTINSYSGGNPLFQLTTTLLKASPIITILAPGREKLQGLNGSNALAPAAKPYDDIEMIMEPVLAPSVKFKPMTGPGIPKLRLYFTEMQLKIVAKKPASCTGLTGAELTDCGNDTRPNGYSYTLGAVRISLSADADFKFITFSNPNNDPNLQNLNALQVVLSTSNLDYTVEVLEGQTYNPFGLDPDGIFSVIEPLVTSLVVPLINSILKEVPLPPQINFPKLRHPTNNTACAINAKSNVIQFFTLATENTSDPYMLGGMRFVGAAASDPSSLIICP
ncbi:Ig-like protein [Leptospira tipperaryensis]|uniref:Ig-like protein n=1 Tax=Leptospira tipperaryensis TaxID=2564040 RepID=A0A1D7UW86_9LEPT|nr:Ig-like domain-containing protein [Leptospira tipperaryensis]AOP33846.1 Ig-like protein [Leptospira tipperaryensis]